MVESCTFICCLKVHYFGIVCNFFSLYNKESVEDKFEMNVPSIIGLAGLLIFLVVASCLYICKKRLVEPLEEAIRNDD